MPSHVHMIIGSRQNKLEEILRDMKSFTSTTMKNAITDHPYESRKEWMLWRMERVGKANSNNNDYQFWQQHNKPLEITSQEKFNKKLDYIHQNPVQSGFVTNHEDWKYSSARDFFGMKGLIELSYS